MILMIALYSLAAISHNPSEQLVPLGIATNMSQHCTKPTRKLSPRAILLQAGTKAAFATAGRRIEWDRLEQPLPCRRLFKPAVSHTELLFQKHSCNLLRG